ncbi:HEPN domain-containing protein [Amycolatopsis decaplanina]|uniref:HEPN domain-containing protein n=1 Tax=Amycolatopsis decaplanina TaxID=208441 RepID=UPI001267F38D|nr:HEPN domain-containing protein [Amycolatopsis decaplanina]
MRIERLKAAIVQVAESLLPDVPLDQQLSPSEQIQVHAFVVISHSAIEEYIEQLLTDSLDEALNKGLAPGGPLPLIALPLAVHHSAEIIGQSSGKGAFITARSVHQKLLGLYTSKVVKPNNGIKRKDIEKLCKPLGIDVAGFDGDLEVAVTALDTLGAKRGTLAHTLSVAAREVIRPEQAREWVNDSIDGIEALTQHIEESVARTVHQTEDTLKAGEVEN